MSGAVAMGLFMRWAMLLAICHMVIATELCDCVDSQPVSFNITKGYEPTDLPNITVALQHSDNHHLVHRCDETTTRLLYDTHFTSDDPQISSSFDGRRFLQQVANSTVLFVGDSLAKQIFIALATALSPYETDFRLGLGLPRPSRKHLEASDEHIAYHYSAYNVTVRLLVDSYLQHVSHTNISTVDLVVMCAGHWFKPLFGLPASTNVPYYPHMEKRAKDFNETIHSYRAAMKLANPSVKVVWKLIAHVGMCDEIQFFPEHFAHRNDVSYWNGLLWSNRTLEATWVKPYNILLRDMAVKHCDMLLDAYDMSHQFLDYVAPHNVQFHRDGLHFCPGGEPRGEIWLLQQVLTRHQRSLAERNCRTAIL